MTKQDSVARVLDEVRRRPPLVQNITNYVVMNNTANALLALGASPAMVHAAEEVEEFVAIADALVINIGTLDRPWIEAMTLAARRAAELDKPWVLDPVGAGATRLRTGTAFDLAGFGPRVIRGNGSEILAIAGADARTRGVDSTAGSADALESAKAVARRFGCVVTVSGATDYVTDGSEVRACTNGVAMLTRVTGMGCTLSAITAACLAAEPDPLLAALAAAAILGVAGELAAERARGPGTLQLEVLDALARLTPAELAARARLS